MIPKMTSHELNNILFSANDKIEKVIGEVKTVKNDISKKLKIMRYEAEYIESQMKELKLTHENTIKPITPGDTVNVFTLLDPELSETYHQYGCTFTPKLKSSPVNIFNIMATATGEAFFRDIAEVAINGIVRKEYKDILKHDSLQDKEIFFEEMDGENPELIIEIRLDTTKVFGACNFNMIEFDPFLNGSYDIEHIRIYSQNNEDYYEYPNFNAAGKMRIILDKTHSFSKVEMKILPKFNTIVNEIKKSPIGIKHIYFYEAQFASESYAMATINSSDYIDTIRDEIVIKTPNGDIETTISKEGIELYLNKTIDSSTGKPIFINKQEPSKPGDTKPISMNVKKIYAKIPLTNKSIVGITFAISSKIF